MWKSTDGGLTWQVLSINGQHEFSMPVFSPAYAEDNTLFIALQSSRILLRSIDAGASWTSHPLPGIPGIFILAPVSSTELFFRNISGPPDSKADEGIYYTNDIGAHWKRLWSGPVMALALSPSYLTDRTLFQGDGGMYRSSDAGQTWTPIMNGLTGRWVKTVVSQISFSPGYTQDQTVFALQGKDVHRTRDAGDHWLNLTNATPNENFSEGILVSPRYSSDQTVWRNGLQGEAFISQDAGDNWQRLPHDLWLESGGQTCDAGGNCGVDVFGIHYNSATKQRDAYKSSDYGWTWQCLQSPYQQRQYLPITART